MSQTNLKSNGVKTFLFVIIGIFMLVLTIYTASAFEICQDVISPNIPCKMITPVLNCSNYTYAVTDYTNTTLASGFLSQYPATDQYFFNFTQPAGIYNIELCDGTSAIVSVQSNASTPVCYNPTPPNISCKMITPPINCSTYDYKIYNTDGSLIGLGLLTNYIGKQYYFSFNQDIGSYVLRLCDDTTADIFVQPGDYIIINNTITLSGSGGGTQTIIVYQNVTASTDLYSGAGITAKSIFWGLDLWSERVYRKFKSDKVAYDITKFDERQKEILKCLSNQRYQCINFTIEELKTRTFINDNINSLDKNDANYIKLQSLVNSYKNKFFTLEVDAQNSGMNIPELKTNYDYLAGLIQ